MMPYNIPSNERGIKPPDGICTDNPFVPASGSGYMCNFNIYSDLTKGEKGICTVVVTVSEY